MILMVVLSLAVAWMLGTLLVSALWPTGNRSCGEPLLRASLGAVLGLGVTSAFHFAASIVSPGPAVLAAAAELITIGLLLTRVRRKVAVRAHREPDPRATEAGLSVAHPPWLLWLVATALVQAIVVASIVAWREWCAAPFGGWDGWAIWNMHARFMQRAGPAWTDLLGASQLNWTHPDYPRLLPASIARAWAWAGAESSLAPALVGAVFAFATLGMLLGWVARQRGWLAGCLAGLLLVGTPFFATFSLSQHADIALGAVMLAAVTLAGVANSSGASPPWLATGLCAGLAAWTKNEGLLFAGVFSAVVTVIAWRGSPRRVGPLLAGLALGLLPTVAFKLLSPTNDLLAAPLGPRLAQLWDVARHRMVLTALWRDVRDFGEWSVSPYVLLLLPLIGWRWRTRLRGIELLAPALAALMLAGYYAVYLLSPHDLSWHLNSSLVRLLLQLWPLAIAGACLWLPAGAADASAAHARRGLVRAGFAVANVALALGLVFACSRQLAADELAAWRRDGVDARIGLGEGWHGIERHEREVWAWSAGHASLRLHVAGVSGAARLRLSLRSLAPRTVTIRQGDRVLWQGSVGETLVPIEIAPFALTPGHGTLDFSTDAPGVAEAAAHGGRSLAFAVYNVRLR